MPMNPLSSQLKKIPFFEGFTEIQLSHLIEKGETRLIPADTLLFKENDPALELFLILKGRVLISGTNAHGEEINLAELEDGKFFGELALADGGSRTASANTLVDSEFFVLSRQAFIQLLSKSPQLLSEVISSISQKIRGSNTQFFQEQLDKQAQLLDMEQKRNQLMAQLVTGVAHEFNTPLGIMKTSANILEETLADLESEDAQDLKVTCHLIESQVHRMSDLIQSFKSISPSEIYAKVEPVTWPEYMDEFMTFYRANSFSNLEVNITLSESAKVQTWEGYPELLNEILMHLFLNIELHAYPVSSGQVDLSLDSDENEFHLTLRDHGAGMSEETLEKAFTPFFTTQRMKGCKGLGLAVVHNYVVYALNGSIDMTSDKGTCVTIIFPHTLKEQ